MSICTTYVLNTPDLHLVFRIPFTRLTISLNDSLSARLMKT